MMDPHRVRALLDAELDRLLDVRRGLEAAMPGGSDRGGELSSRDQHQADVGSEVFEQEKERSILYGVDADLTAVSEALMRLDEGTYGRCETCGAPIADDRLEAVPAARFCASHEARWERRLRSLSLPAGADGDTQASANLIAGREGARSMEFLPTDDDADVLELPAEEQAMHATYLDTARSEAMGPAEVELAEMRDAEARSDERFEAFWDEEADRTAVEAAVVDEEDLGEDSPRQRQALWRRLVRRPGRR